MAELGQVPKPLTRGLWEAVLGKDLAHPTLPYQE